MSSSFMLQWIESSFQMKLTNFSMPALPTIPTPRSMDIDVVYSFIPKYEVKISTNPVQKGMDVSDNIRPTPDILTIDGGFSDKDNGGQSWNNWQQLQSIQKSAFECSFTTNNETYEGFYIKDLTPTDPLEMSTGVINFKLILQHLVTTNIVTAVIPKSARTTNTKGKDDSGNKDGKTIETPAKSLLKGGTGAGGPVEILKTIAPLY